MTRGISEELLKEIDSYYIHSSNSSYLLDKLITQCAELNPWLPIEQAPSDRDILIRFSNGEMAVNNIRHTSGFVPTHWMELPEDPK